MKKSASDTRQKIIDTARDLFHEQGYHATGMATILRLAGVNSGSLYHFFSSKGDLLEAVLDSYIEGLQPMLIAPVEAATDDPLERVFGLLNQYREALLMTDFSYGCPIGNLALEMGADEGAITERIDANFIGWRAAIRSWLADAFAERDADIDGLTALTLAVMEGALMQARVAKKIEPFDEAVAQYRKMLEALF